MFKEEINSIFSSKCFILTEAREKLLPLLDKITKQAGVPAMIIGGAALSKYNYNRSTEDIDIVTTVDDAYKIGDLLQLNKDFTFIGNSKFKHIPSGLSINFCPEGVKAGHGKFPKPEGSEPGLHYVKLPSLLAMKIQAKRQKDRGDYVELIKRNAIPWHFIEQEVLPLLSSMDKKWATILWKQAQKESL